MYDFETRIDRRETASIKWDLDRKRTGREGLLPFWVADMDFPVAPEISRALAERLDHRIFGYTFRPESLDEALIGWFEDRHNWKIPSDMIVEAPGIVPFLHMAVQNLTDPGDAVVIQEPVYYPFRTAVERNSRTVANNPLIRDTDGRWRMDTEGLERLIDETGARLLIFCSPHNPAARVWREDELLILADICRRRNVTVISDEIHADLVHSGHRHIPWLSLPEEQRPPSLSLISATKTFNLPGLTTAYAVVDGPETRLKMKKMLGALGLGGGSSAPLSYTAAEAAWRHGGPWLDTLLNHLKKNDQRLREYLKATLPDVKPANLEGTYLEWLDFSALGLDDDELWTRVLDAGLWLSRGREFGHGGEQHLRWNIACPASQLDEGLELLNKALG